jgi:8-oxo-dGTP pyrophosphatase MutT (NUDIX family)
MDRPAIEAQIQQLAEEYGTPLRWTVTLENDGFFDPLGKTDRYGEVCMVVRRPNGKLLTAIKTFYPAGAYRLLTGGIHHGEQVHDALLRETAEETGLEVLVTRFLAVVDYRQPGDDPTAPAPFTSFAFLLDESGGTLHCADPGERVEAFREIEVDELPTIANYLAALTDEQSDEINGRWRDWGRFRAVIHRAVHEALST